MNKDFRENLTEQQLGLLKMCEAYEPVGAGFPGHNLIMLIKDMALSSDQRGMDKEIWDAVWDAQHAGHSAENIADWIRKLR